MDQAAPTQAETTMQSARTRTCGRMPTSAGPSAAVITAASRNCPSPPRFQMSARKATISPAPIKSSGAMRVKVSCSPPQVSSPRRAT